MSPSPAVSNDIFAANRAFGRLALAVKATNGITRRAHVREEGPLRVRCPGAPSAELEAVIVNTAGGVAGGDSFVADVSVREAARLLVTSAAAEKIYRSLGPNATIELNLKVEAGASLAWLPHQTILFDRARLARSVDVALADDATLVFAEAVVFGRLGMGETVRHGLLSDNWRIYRGGRILHAEALRLEGEIACKLAHPAIGKGARAMATVLMIPADETLVARVRALSPLFRGEVAASAWKGMMVIRLCARDGAALHHDLITVMGVLRGLSLPRLWLN
jgi:urease accessory protein